MLCIITCLNYVFSKLMFFLFFIGNFDIFYCSNYFILFFIIVGFTYFVLQFRVNSINPISSRLSLSVIYKYNTRNNFTMLIQTFIVNLPHFLRYYFTIFIIIVKIFTVKLIMVKVIVIR